MTVEFRIAHVSPYASPIGGGISETIRSIAVNWPQQDNLEIFTANDSLLSADRPRWAGVRINAFENSFVGGIRYCPAAGQAIKAWEPNLIHSHGLWTHFSVNALGASKHASVPRIVSPHGMLEDWAFNHHKARKLPLWLAWEKRALNSATAIHVTSQSEAAAVRRRGIRAPIFVVPLGIDVSDMSDTRDTTASERARAGHDRTALFLSRLHPKKGLLDLIEAWSIVRPEGWKLVVAGPSELGEAERASESIQALGLARQVSLIGPVASADKGAAFANAELFLLPSYSENFGLVVLEALHCGIPTLTTDQTPWTDLAQTGCGWVVSPGTSGIVPALRQATALSRQELVAMAPACRQYAQPYTWPQTVSKLREVYGWALGASPVPAHLQYG